MDGQDSGEVLQPDPEVLIGEVHPRQRGVVFRASCSQLTDAG